MFSYISSITCAAPILELMLFLKYLGSSPSKCVSNLWQHGAGKEHRGTWIKSLAVWPSESHSPFLSLSLPTSEIKTWIALLEAARKVKGQEKYENKWPKTWYIASLSRFVPGHFPQQPYPSRDRPANILKLLFYPCGQLTESWPWRE